MTARTAATLTEIMARLRQPRTRTAMIYQHATSEPDREITQARDLMIAEARAVAGNTATQPQDSGQDAGPAPVA